MNYSRKPNAGLRELRDFLEGVRLSVEAVDEQDTETRRLYRKFYSLLIYDFLLDNESDEDTVSLYARESISDISHSFFLSFIGLYKPARVCLRSGIENFVRYILLSNRVDALAITYLPTLFAEVKSIYADRASQRARFDVLRSLYAALCQTVHSTGEEYMNLNVPFSSLLIVDPNKFAVNRELLLKVCGAIGEIMFVDQQGLIAKAHHTLRDTLSDNVPPSVRREVREAREI